MLGFKKEHNVITLQKPEYFVLKLHYVLHTYYTNYKYYYTKCHTVLQTIILNYRQYYAHTTYTN